MKQLLLFFSIFSCTTGIFAQDIPYVAVPDHEPYITFQKTYETFSFSLNEKIKSGDIVIYTKRSCKKALDSFSREVYDWLGVRFGKKYMTIILQDDSEVYFKRGDLFKLDIPTWQLLEYIQMKAELPLTGYQTIENNTYKIYDAIQNEIYLGILAGKLRIYDSHDPDKEMDRIAFDTAFDQELMEWNNTLQEYLNLGKEEFSAEKISGMCRTRDEAYYGLCYLTFKDGDERNQPMCWIKNEDIQSFLADGDLIFLTTILDTAIATK